MAQWIAPRSAETLVARPSGAETSERAPTPSEAPHKLVIGLIGCGLIGTDIVLELLHAGFDPSQAGYIHTVTVFHFGACCPRAEHRLSGQQPQSIEATAPLGPHLR